MTDWTEKARELAGGHRVVDGDCWFTCPQAEDPEEPGHYLCCDDSRSGGPCECGLDERVQQIAAALREAYERGREQGAREAYADAVKTLEAARESVPMMGVLAFAGAYAAIAERARGPMSGGGE